MASPDTIDVASLPDYIGFLEGHRAAATGPLWYRGCDNGAYDLKPSLYRHASKTSPDDVAQLEVQLMDRFRQRSLPFLSRSMPEDDWGKLFLMQHFGIPTRLLDWTENPFVALFFAVMGAKRTTSARAVHEFRSDCAVWVLDSTEWNRHALRHQSFAGGVLSAEDPELVGYEPLGTFGRMNVHPVAMYGAHNSQRIVAQRGVFTVFGQGTAAMQAIFHSEGFPQNCVKKLVIRRENIGNLRQAVTEYGITDSVVFPDLEGLAREIKRQFGFSI